MTRGKRATIVSTRRGYEEAAAKIAELERVVIRQRSDIARLKEKLADQKTQHAQTVHDLRARLDANVSEDLEAARAQVAAERERAAGYMRETAAARDKLRGAVRNAAAVLKGTLGLPIEEVIGVITGSPERAPAWSWHVLRLCRLRRLSRWSWRLFVHTRPGSPLRRPLSGLW